MNVAHRLPVVLVEDDAVRALGPIVHTRPAFELRCGALNLRERILLSGVATTVHARVRSELSSLLTTVGLTPPPTAGDVLAVDARLHAAVETLRDALGALGPGERRTVDGTVAAVRIDATELDRCGLGDASDAPPLDRVARFTRPWQIVPSNDEALVDDAATLRETGAPDRRIFGVEFVEGSRRPACLRREDWIESDDLEARFPQVTWIEPVHALVAESARVRPGAVIDAEDGPVVLGPGVVVNPLAVVTGPAYLGPGTVVNPGAKLREGTDRKSVV